MTPLLEIENLSVTYRASRGNVVAVHDVSFALEAGKTIGIAGESGSGKSTVASAVLRLHPKSTTVTGRVSVAGNDVNALSWGALRRMRWTDAAMVFQGAMHSLNPIDSIGKQVAEPVLIHAPSTTKAAANARVAELLEMVGLTAEHAYSYPHQLSGGQKQRVMIAMALACNPKLLIADEPTTALDVKVQAQILEVLASLSAELGLGLMLISHDLSVLASVCDQVLVMYGGRVVEQGPGAEIFEHPRHPYTRALASAFPTIGDPASRYRPQGAADGGVAGIDPAAELAFVERCRLNGDCLVHRPEFARFVGNSDPECLRADDLGTNRLEMEAAR